MDKDDAKKTLSETEWYRSRIDHVTAHAEAMSVAMIQINASLIQLCARLADNSKPNDTQMLLSLLPLLNKEEKADDPKVLAQLQRIAETLRKEPEKERKNDGH